MSGNSIPVTDLFGNQQAWPACPICKRPADRFDDKRHRLCDKCFQSTGGGNQL